MAVGLRIGRYELGERLGTGGFGVVYLARDTELGRELAIKVLRPEYQTQPDVVARFLKEARAAAKIDHPGIVTVFECGTITDSGTAQDGNAYIAMELLRGYSLTQHLERKGRMSPGDAILIGRQVAAALSVAHAAGIVHRDLKPDNVFLLPDPLVKGGFRIKILDFGVAKLAEPKEAGVNTHSQMMLGTPKYMSPEQARSARAVDARTDIYTLGCMLYEMVTAQAPYEGPGAIDMIIQHTTAPIPSASAVVQDMPASLDALIRRMMEKEADDRPDSMQAIDQALGEIQAEIVPPSIPPTPARAKAQSAPPPVPRVPPARPTPAPPQQEPTGLTPTPAVTLSRQPPRPTPAPPVPPTPASSQTSMPRASAPQVRPTPQPPARPSPMASGTVADSSPFSQPTLPRPNPTVEAFTFEQHDIEQPTQPRRSSSRVPLLVAIAVITAGIAAGAVWFVKRPSTKPTDRPVATTGDASAPAAKLPAGELAALEKECVELEKTEFWNDLKACSDRLKPYQPDAAARFWKKGDDESANEKKWLGVKEQIEAKNFSKARDLVKRIGESSVYTARAHKMLDEAEAAAKQ
jgi:serine/threonine-protein kinase